MSYIDTHAHFDLCIGEGVAVEGDLVAGLGMNGIAGAVHVTIDTGGFSWALEFARRHAGRGIRFTLGIHPSSRGGDGELSKLDRFVKNVMESDDAPLLFGIGETGLDFYRLRQPKDDQIRSFEHQIQLAKKWDLPLIVHSRDAAGESLALLGNYAPVRGIMHCFSEGSAMARRFLDLGFHLSFAGNVTYRAALPLQESAAYAPEDRLLLETDAPFLTPVPLRGRKNRPDYVKHTYAFVAELRGTNRDALAAKIEENFMSLLPAGKGGAH